MNRPRRAGRIDNLDEKAKNADFPRRECGCRPRIDTRIEWKGHRRLKATLNLPALETTIRCRVAADWV